MKNGNPISWSSSLHNALKKAFERLKKKRKLANEIGIHETSVARLLLGERKWVDQETFAKLLKLPEFKDVQKTDGGSVPYFSKEALELAALYDTLPDDLKRIIKEAQREALLKLHFKNNVGKECVQYVTRKD